MSSNSSGSNNNSGSSNNSAGSGGSGIPDNNTAKSLAINENSEASNGLQNPNESVNTQNNSEGGAGSGASQSSKSNADSAPVKPIMNPDRYPSSAAVTPVWKLCVGAMEVVVLGVLSQFIVSDMRVIMWFEQKKKRRL